jgi:hypothetical protein
MRGSTGAWWASYIAALPTDHQVPWGEFRTAFHAHHLSVGLLHTKLQEFLDLEQGNHSVFDYTSTVWCIPHLGVSCVDHNSSRVGAIAYNSNSGNFSNNTRSSSSTVPLPHRHSRMPLGLHNNSPPATFHASTVG